MILNKPMGRDRGAERHAGIPGAKQRHLQATPRPCGVDAVGDRGRDLPGAGRRLLCLSLHRGADRQDLQGRREDRE